MRFSLKDIKNNIYFYPSLLLLIFLITQITVFLTSQKNTLLFHGEVANIAKSIVSGNGFANPFYYEDSEPTSWQPPLLPYFIASIFLLFGQTISAFMIICLLGKLILFFSYVYLLKAFDQFKINYNKVLLFLTILVYFVFFNSPGTISINYGTLAILFTGLIMYYSAVFIKEGKYIFFIVAGFLIPILVPSLALPFTVLIALFFFFWLIKQKSKLSIFPINKKITLKPFFLIGISFCFSVLIWTTRNYIVFKEIIPSKSNIWFEFYMSNVVDKVGILHHSTWRVAHPMENKKLCESINKLGETGWLKQYEKIGEAYKTNHKKEYRKKIFNRFINAFIFIDYSYDFISTNYLKNLNADTKSVLEKQKFILDDSYLTLYYSDIEIQSKIASLPLAKKEKEELLIDWRKARILLLQDKKKPTRLYHGILKATLPTLAIILLLVFFFMKKFNKPEFLIVAVTLYLVYFIPYVLISHEIRYQRPVLLLQVAFVYLFIQTILNNIGIKAIKQNEMF